VVQAVWLLVLASVIISRAFTTRSLLKRTLASTTHLSPWACPFPPYS
jgi:hypothetical protein